MVAMGAKRGWTPARGCALLACALSCSAPAAGTRDATATDAANRDARSDSSVRDSAAPDAQRDAATTDVPGVLYARPGVTATTITTDGDFLYWQEDTFRGSSIVQAPLHGNGPVVDLGPTSASVGSITTDDSHVYWMGSDSFILSEDSNIRIAPKGGGEVRQIQLNGQYPVGQLAVDGTHVYVASGNCQTIARVAKTGGEVTRIDNPIPDRRGGATSIAVDDQRIYCGSGNDARIFGGDKHGTSVDLLFESVQGEISRRLGRIGLAGPFLYTMQIRGSNVELRYEILRLPTAGGDMETLAVFEDGGGGGGISFDPTAMRMYFLTSARNETGSDYVLASFDVNTRQRVVTPTAWTRHGVAVTRTHAHWINANIDTSFIMRAPVH